jgi:hypothetical protein
LLAKPDSPSRALLWSLLARTDLDDAPAPEGAAPSVADDSPLGATHRIRHWTGQPWVRRQAVAASLNGVILFIVVASLGYKLGWSWHGWLAFGAFKLFAIWVLSFFPGWLFVRFLGQRAAALWWDFVLALHRLGADEAQYLPEPPLDSAYHEEWLDAGGAPLARAGSIYQEKFDAYYGKSVSRIGAERDTRVHAETLFPVFLTTAVLAASWTAVLWRTSFAFSPSGPGDMLKFAFLGCYSFIAQMLMRRYYQNDLKASAYASCVIRLFVVAILIVVVHQIPGLRHNPGSEAIVAFLVGFFPLIGMQALQRVAAAALRVAVPSLNPAYPLSQIDGLNVWYEARLVEEGVEDMQNLATANLVDVILHTHVPVGRLVDWVDQAHLYQHLDRAESGMRELRLARRGALPAVIGAVSHARPPDGSTPPHGPTVAPSASYRDGTRARHALRNLGVRTATDLLKLFPPDARSTSDAEWLRDRGLDPHSVIALVRLLAAEPGINLVWNWQGGATAARRFSNDDRRQPSPGDTKREARRAQDAHNLSSTTQTPMARAGSGSGGGEETATGAQGGSQQRW